MNRHAETTEDLATLLRWAERGKGWAFRDYPPQFKRLAGGCELVVVVPTLWRPRVGPRPRPVCAPISLAQTRAQRVLADACRDAKRCPAAAIGRTGDLFEGMQA